MFGLLSLAVLGCAPAQSPGLSTTMETTEPSEPSPSVTTTTAATTTTTTVSTPCEGTFPDAWISGGSACSGAQREPEIQVHAYDDETTLLRQSLCTSYEAPFLFLLFGADRALLLDTGAGGIDLVGAVQDIIVAHDARTGRTTRELLVLNSHGHGDHTAANNAFSSAPNTVVVGATSDALSTYFAMAWPNGQAEIDLGGRIVDLWPIPGHQSAHIALYDRDTGLLLTGDSLYPGRLYVSDFDDFRDSMRKLVTVTADLEVCHVLGTHIEMTRTAGEEYNLGTTAHPDEHVLELDRGHLVELADALDAMAGNPRRETHDDFVIVP